VDGEIAAKLVRMHHLTQRQEQRQEQRDKRRQEKQTERSERQAQFSNAGIYDNMEDDEDDDDEVRPSGFRPLIFSMLITL
jgi:hypothetical protein